MREHLEYLSRSVERIDGDNIYEALREIKDIFQELLIEIDRALPVDKSDDV